MLRMNKCNNQLSAELLLQEQGRVAVMQLSVIGTLLQRMAMVVTPDEVTQASCRLLHHSSPSPTTTATPQPESKGRAQCSQRTNVNLAHTFCFQVEQNRTREPEDWCVGIPWGPSLTNSLRSVSAGQAVLCQLTSWHWREYLNLTKHWTNGKSAFDCKRYSWGYVQIEQLTKSSFVSGHYEDFLSYKTFWYSLL